MSTQSEPIAAPPVAARPWIAFRPSAMVVAGIAVTLLLTAVAVVAARYSMTAFVVAGIALVLFLAAAAVRWPHALVILVVLMPVFDRYLVIGLLPRQAWETAYFTSEALLLGVGPVILARAHVQGRLIEAFRHPVTLGLAALVALCAVSALVNAVPPVVALAGVVFTIDAAACFYLPRLVGFTQRQATVAIGAFVGLVVAAALVALAQAVLSPTILGLVALFGVFGESYRLASFFADPNTFGAFLVAAAPFAIFATTALSGRGARRWAFAVAFLLVLALWLSFSRGAWLAMLVGGGVVAALVDRRALLVGAVITLLTFGVAIAMPRDLLLQGGGGDGRDGRPELIDSTLGRIDTIGRGRDLRTQFVLNGLPILADHPVLGVGPGRYGGAAADIFGTPIYAEYGTDRLFTLDVQSTVDNFWLHLVVELGLLGTLAYLGTLFAAGVPILRAARAAAGRQRVLLAGIAAASAAIAVNAVTTMMLEGNSVAFAFWFLLGTGSLLVTADRRTDTDVAAEPAAAS